MADIRAIAFDHLRQKYAASKVEGSADAAIADAVRASLFPAQLAVLEDPYRRKSAICPRRAGKSWTAMSYGIDTCLRIPQARVVIVCLTRLSAKNIYWTEIQRFLRKFGAKSEYHHTDLRITFRNESQMNFIGADSRAEIDKLRGGKYHLVIIDECKSYPSALLRELMTESIEPALGDYEGTLLMIGTPGSVLDGPFFEATFPGAKGEGDIPFSRTYADPEHYWREGRTRRPQWSRHEWTRADNVRMPHLWAEALQIKEDRGWADDHPVWQREYLGKWVASDSAYVYNYATLIQTNPAMVSWTPQRTRENPTGLPDLRTAGWRFILGCDLGFEDAFAACVGAYSPYDNSLYHVWDFKATHQDVHQIAQIIGDAWTAFGGFDAMVGDGGGLGKMVLETLQRRFGLHVQPAEKREKFDHIEILNAEFNAGTLKIIPDSDLAKELRTLQYDLSDGAKEQLARTGKLREHPGMDNHLTDSFLYLCRFAYHYWSAPRVVEHTPYTPEWRNAREEADIARLTEEQANPSNIWDRLRAGSKDPLEHLSRRGN